MKVIFLLGLLILSTYGAQMFEEAGKLHFEADANQDGLVGLVMKGFVDPKDVKSSSAEAFFRLAETLIPIAESVVSDATNGGFQYYKYWCYGNPGDAFSVCFYANAELFVGWRVSQVGQTGSYNVTYTPFTLFRAGGNASAASYPAEFAYGGYISIVDIKIPINLLLAQSQICYSATFNMAPTEAYTSFNTKLLQCERSVPDRTPWACEKLQGLEFKQFEWEFTSGTYINLLPYSCINF